MFPTIIPNTSWLVTSTKRSIDAKDWVAQNWKLRHIITAEIGRCLRRALDVKLRKLRSMLTADEDISTELDKVVCRLMKLALKTGKGNQEPPPSRWMQCKLFDLLSLTEKAIERRKRHFIENYAFNALDQDNQAKDILAIANTKEDESVPAVAESYKYTLILCMLIRNLHKYWTHLTRIFRIRNKLVDKYHHVVQSYERKEEMKKFADKCSFDFLYQEDDLNNIRNEFVKDHVYLNTDSSNIVYVDTVSDSGLHYKILYNEDETKLQRVQAWIDDDVEIVPYPNHDVRDINSGDTDNSVTNSIYHRFKKSSRKHKAPVTDKHKTLGKKHTYPKTKYDNKTNSNKSKLLKKIPKKKSSYNILIKTYRTNNTSSADYENYKIRNKIKHQDKKQNLLSNMAKPIPESLTRLCSPEIKIKQKIEQVQCSITEVSINVNPDFIIENETDIAATEESLLIDIVMDGAEETIALRRTIGTDISNTTEFEQESNHNSVVNVMREDSFCNMHEMTTDNVQSKAIFLYDINEPCTSKGLRHIHMDVQCGPDVTINNLPTLSAATSFTKFVPTGIKIGDLFTNIRTQNGTDFGTCTDDRHEDCKTILPRTLAVGIKIKDSDSIICNKVECSTMTYCQNNITENEGRTSSRLRTEDSYAEFSENVESYRKSQIQFASFSKNTSDIRINSLVNEEIGTEGKYLSTKYIRPKLCRGGVYIHSYKEQQESSDVLFQGQWQRYKPKALSRKRIIHNSLIKKRVSDIPNKIENSKEKIDALKIKCEVKTKQMKSTQKQSHIQTLDKMKGGSATNKNLSNNLIKSVKLCRNATKVTSKLAISSITCKNIKSVCYPKRSAAIMSTVSNKEYGSENQINKKYMPMYLKRNKAKLVTNKCVMYQSKESPKAMLTVNKNKHIEQVAPLQTSKTIDIKKHLLKFPDKPRDNICFFVFRNDTDNNKNDGQVPESTKGNIKKKDSSGRRTYSPQSQNSSSCSSPNSIATVRTVRTKMISARKHSTSHTIGNIDSGNIILLKKKFNKKNKTGKKADDKAFDNKENIPEPSTKCNINKKSDKITSFVGVNKSMYRTQKTAESGSLQYTLNSLSGRKSQLPIKSSTKLTTDDNRSINVTLSRTRTSISPVSSAHKVSSNRTFVLTSAAVSVQEIQDAFLTLESEHDFENKKFGQYSQIENKSNNALFTDMKRMVEEILAFIEKESETPIDSETVILNREDLQKSNHDDRSSQGSFKTIVTNEDVISSLRSGIENAMNRTFDSILIDEPLIDVKSADAIISDLDLLSFTSITTPASRISEYFLADTELNNNEPYVRSESSVRDIFERKEQLQIQSTAGALAIQAFSGFSMNFEPVGGDRLDPVNFIDSETGSMALEMARQTVVRNILYKAIRPFVPKAASEELFTSGRSSETFESCLIDEDDMVPYWLFQNSRQSVDEEEPVELHIPIPVPLPEHMYDANGNVLPEVGAGAGAGDGRGMHSDNSQDSSGRGTTTDSSESSSGGQSEAILIDPSVLAVQFEMIREALDNSDAPPLSTSLVLADTSYDTAEAEEHEGDASSSRNGHRMPLIPLATSDMDADVSSLDTDILDSSDN